MNYSELAHELIQNMLTDSKDDRTETEPFSSGEMKMLGCLYVFKDGMTAGELCQKLSVTTPRIAQLLNTLEKKGSICRKSDTEGKHDKRTVLVYLTDEGRVYTKKRYDEYVAFTTRLFSTLGEAETKEYLRLSKRIKEIIKEIDKEVTNYE